MSTLDDNKVTVTVLWCTDIFILITLTITIIICCGKKKDVSTLENNVQTKDQAEDKIQKKGQPEDKPHEKPIPHHKPVPHVPLRSNTKGGGPKSKKPADFVGARDYATLHGHNEMKLSIRKENPNFNSEKTMGYKIISHREIDKVEEKITKKPPKKQIKEKTEKIKSKERKMEKVKSQKQKDGKSKPKEEPGEKIKQQEEKVEKIKGQYETVEKIKTPEEYVGIIKGQKEQNVEKISAEQDDFLRPVAKVSGEVEVPKKLSSVAPLSMPAKESSFKVRILDEELSAVVQLKQFDGTAAMRKPRSLRPGATTTRPQEEPRPQTPLSSKKEGKEKTRKTQAAKKYQSEKQRKPTSGSPSASTVERGDEKTAGPHTSTSPTSLPTEEMLKVKIKTPQRSKFERVYGEQPMTTTKNNDAEAGPKRSPETFHVKGQVFEEDRKKAKTSYRDRERAKVKDARHVSVVFQRGVPSTGKQAPDTKY